MVTNSNTNTVGVLLNAGGGTFLSQTTYPVGSSPHTAAVADLNNDNKPDIVVANLNLNNVGALLNSGTGGFLSQTTYTQLALAHCI